MVVPKALREAVLTDCHGNTGDLSFRGVQNTPPSSPRVLLGLAQKGCRGFLLQM